jgi:hypothetical protein
MTLPAFTPITLSVPSVMLFTTLLVFPICTNSNGSEEREEAEEEEEEEEEYGFHCGVMIDLNGKGKYKAMILLMVGRPLEYKSDGLMLRRMLTV